MTKPDVDRQTYRE